jgi:hypothetical protein
LILVKKENGIKVKSRSKNPVGRTGSKKFKIKNLKTHGSMPEQSNGLTWRVSELNLTKVQILLLPPKQRSIK